MSYYVWFISDFLYNANDIRFGWIESKPHVHAWFIYEYVKVHEIVVRYRKTPGSPRMNMLSATQCVPEGWNNLPFFPAWIFVKEVKLKRKSHVKNDSYSFVSLTYRYIDLSYFENIVISLSTVSFSTLQNQICGHEIGGNSSFFTIAS